MPSADLKPVKVEAVDRIVLIHVEIVERWIVKEGVARNLVDFATIALPPRSLLLRSSLVVFISNPFLLNWCLVFSSDSLFGCFSGSRTVRHIYLQKKPN